MPGAAYRARAAELRAEAELKVTPEHKSELEALALRYLRLAEQAELNGKTDIVYSTPPTRDEHG
jgi:hypothetical protein